MRRLRPAERAILAAIRRERDQSRAMLAARLGLSPALLSGTISRFLDEGWITERRARRPARRGQPALHLRLRRGAVAGLGLSLSTGGIRAACVDLDGTVLGTSRADVSAQDFGAGLAIAEEAVAGLLDKAASFAGVTIWAPAMIGARGEIMEVTPSQRGVDFAAYRSALEARFGLPVHLESKCPAIDEALHVTDPDAVVFMMFLDYGVGGSMIDGLRVFRGGHGQAVNIGALLPDSGIRPSLPDLAAYLGQSEPGPGLLRRLEADDDPRLAAWISSRGRALSEPLSIVVQLFNPSDIVLGGLFPRRVFERLMAEIRLDLYDAPGRVPIRKPELRIARLVGEDALASSAASVSIYKVLSDAHGGAADGTRQS